jgi:hypothetical protein
MEEILLHKPSVWKKRKILESKDRVLLIVTSIFIGSLLVMTLYVVHENAVVATMYRLSSLTFNKIK